MKREVYDQICGYFDHVINYVDFVLAVDKAGVFVFADARDRSDDDLQDRVSELASVLALRDDQMIVCCIDDKSSNVFCSLDFVEREGDKEYLHHVPTKYLEDFVRKYSAKESILTDDDIVSIVECFQDFDSKKSDREHLYEELLEYGVAEGQAKELLSSFVVTKDAVYKAGVKHEDVDEVYQKLTADMNSLGLEVPESDAVMDSEVIVGPVMWSLCIAILGVVAGMFDLSIVGLLLHVIALRRLAVIRNRFDFLTVHLLYWVLMCTVIFDFVLLLPDLEQLLLLIRNKIAAAGGMKILNPLRWMEWIIEAITGWE